MLIGTKHVAHLKDATASQFSHMLLRDNIDSLSYHFHPFWALQLLHKFRCNIQQHHK
jgi:hypothetical protein